MSSNQFKNEILESQDSIRTRVSNQELHVINEIFVCGFKTSRPTPNNAYLNGASVIWARTCQISGGYFNPPVGIIMVSTGLYFNAKKLQPNFLKTLDLVQPKMSSTLSFSGMYRK